jgi:hypothetical protein
MKTIVAYYDNSIQADYYRAGKEARESLPEGERRTARIICKPKKDDNMQELSQQEKEQIAKQSRFVAGIIRSMGTDAISVGVLKKEENDFVTDGMIERFWHAVADSRVPQSIFLMSARVALKHKLLADERGSSCCGGAAGFRALAIPGDFEARVEKFLKPKEKKKARTTQSTKQMPSQGRQQMAFAGL